MPPAGYFSWRKKSTQKNIGCRKMALNAASLTEGIETRPPSAASDNNSFRAFARLAFPGGHFSETGDWIPAFAGMKYLLQYLKLWLFRERVANLNHLQ